MEAPGTMTGAERAASAAPPLSSRDLRRRVAAHARAGERAPAERRIALFERGLGRVGEGAVLLDRRGGVVAVGPRARRLLRERPGDGELRARTVPDEEEVLVLLAEPRSERLAPRALARRLPVSTREAEVLSLLAKGRPNAAIACELGISPHTVARHLERIYAKLGVHSRMAAASAALGAAG